MSTDYRTSGTAMMIQVIIVLIAAIQKLTWIILWRLEGG
jgi:hypothetical protein